jgi:tight adherence protein C
MESALYFPAVAAALAFGGIFLLAVGLYVFYVNQRRRQGLRAKIAQASSSSLIKRTAGKQESLGQALVGFLSSLGKRGGVSEKDAEGYSPMRIKFLRAGIRWPRAPFVFLGTKLFLLICFVLVFLILRVSVLELVDTRTTLAVIVALALVGYFIPDIWLALRTVRRKRVLFEGLPDALDLLVVCVEAGMGLDAAISRVAEELAVSNKPLCDELELYSLELRAGKTREGALRDLSSRMDLEDVRGLVTLLIQADRFGMSIAQSLRVFSDSFRTQRFQRAEELAAKLPVKLVIPMIVFIFPTLFIVIMGPTVIRVWELFF